MYPHYEMLPNIYMVYEYCSSSFPKNLTYHLIPRICSRTQKALLDPQQLPQMVVNVPRYVENLQFRVLVKLLTIINNCECWFTQAWNDIILCLWSGSSQVKFLFCVFFFFALQLLWFCSPPMHLSGSPCLMITPSWKSKMSGSNFLINWKRYTSYPPSLDVRAVTQKNVEAVVGNPRSNTWSEGRGQRNCQK